MLCYDTVLFHLFFTIFHKAATYTTAEPLRRILALHAGYSVVKSYEKAGLKFKASERDNSPQLTLNH